jgi:hypothetical protein
MSASTARTRLTAATHEDRIMTMLDGITGYAKEVLLKAKKETPQAFEERRDRRAEDCHTGTDTIDCTGVILGNDDIVCDRGEAKPDGAFTLAIYPKPSDFS